MYQGRECIISNCDAKSEMEGHHMCSLSKEDKTCVWQDWHPPICLENWENIKHLHKDVCLDLNKIDLNFFVSWNKILFESMYTVHCTASDLFSPHERCEHKEWRSPTESCQRRSRRSQIILGGREATRSSSGVGGRAATNFFECFSLNYRWGSTLRS